MGGNVDAGGVGIARVRGQCYYRDHLQIIAAFGLHEELVDVHGGPVAVDVFGLVGGGGGVDFWSGRIAGSLVDQRYTGDNAVGHRGAWRWRRWFRRSRR